MAADRNMTGVDAAALALFSMVVDIEHNICSSCSDIESRNSLMAVFILSMQDVVDLSATDLSTLSFFQSMSGNIAFVILSNLLLFLTNLSDFSREDLTSRISGISDALYFCF